jgi:hypothetical protein
VCSSDLGPEFSPVRGSHGTSCRPEFSPVRGSQGTSCGPEFSPVRGSHGTSCRPEFSPVRGSHGTSCRPEFSPVRGSQVTSCGPEFSPVRGTQGTTAGQFARNSSLLNILLNIPDWPRNGSSYIPRIPSALHFYHCIRRQNPLYLMDRSLSGSQDRPRLNASVNRKAVELRFLRISVCSLVAILVSYCGCMSLALFEIFFSAPYLQTALTFWHRSFTFKF